MERRTLVLDTGAVIALTKGNRAARAMMTVAQQEKADVVVPPAVITQVVRGGTGDALVHRLLAAVRTSFVGRRLAVEAGRLLGIAGHTDVADAQVMAEALRSKPSILLTSDVNDMAAFQVTPRQVKIYPI